MTKVDLTQNEIKILISWLKSKRTRILNKGWLYDVNEFDEVKARIKFLENLK